MKKCLFLLTYAVLGFMLTPRSSLADEPQQHDTSQIPEEEGHAPLQVSPKKPQAIPDGTNNPIASTSTVPGDDPGYQETWRIGTGQSK